MSSIFEPGVDLRVDFDDLDINFEQRAFDRLLYQFRNSPILREYLFARIEEAERVHKAAVQVLRFRTIAEAEGVVLDVIGRIIGQPRIAFNASNRQWFGPDVVDDQLGPPDRAPAYTQNAPLFGDEPADDAQYRQLILAKIFKNHVYGSTIPELIRFISFFSDSPASVRTSGPMQIDLIVAEDFPLNVLATLFRVVDDRTADRKYLLPVAATVNIRAVVYRPDTPFAPDRAANAPDIGEAATGVPATVIEGIL